MMQVEVLGLPLFARDIPAAVELVVQGCLEEGTPRTRCISATGAHGLVHAQQDPDFHTLLRRFPVPEREWSAWEGRGGECWRFHGTPVLGRCVQDAA